ncbi:hypothetical protein ACVW0K_007380 [Streptomyces filamentosus]
MTPDLPDEEGPVDDCGIIDTNLPTVKVLWERRGLVIWQTTVAEPPPPYLPPWKRPVSE